jgi:hypothetical protein
MPELDEQLRRYFDATAPAVETDPASMRRSDAGVLILLEDHPKHRARSPRVLVAAVVIAVAGLVAAALLWTGDGSNGTETGPVEQPDPPPMESSTAELVWTKTSYSVPDSTAVVIGDGAELFVIGTGVDSSLDGVSWENRDIADMPSVESLTGDWTASDAASGKVVHLVINNGEARTFLFDVDAGLVDESTIVPAWATEDLRGTIAVNDDGEAVVWLFDLTDRSSVPTAGFYSADGSEWFPIDRDQLPTDVILSPVALGDEFVAVRTWPGASATYWHSLDGREWSAVEADGTLHEVVSWGNAVVAGDWRPERAGEYTAYGLTAAAATELALDLSPLSVFGFYPKVAAGGVGFAAVSPTGHLDGLTTDGSWFIDHSSDGVTWVRQTLPFVGELNSDDIDVSVNTEQVLVRADRQIWVGTRPSQPLPDPVTPAAGPEPAPLSDGDGIALEWNQVQFPGAGGAELLEHTGDAFVLVDGSARWFTSTDGDHWQQLPLDGVVDVPQRGDGLPHPVSGFGTQVTIVEPAAPVTTVDITTGRVELGPLLGAQLDGGTGPAVATGAAGSVVVEHSGTAWHTSGDGEWVEITSSDPFGGSGQIRVAAMETGFAAAVQVNGPMMDTGFPSDQWGLWFSDDGIVWEQRAQHVSLSDFPQALLAWNEGAIAAWPLYKWRCCSNTPSPSSGGTMFVSPDLIDPLEATDLAALDGVTDEPPAGIDAGPFGIALAFPVGLLTNDGDVDESVALVEFSSDGEAWSRRPLPAEVGFPARVAVGTDRVLLLGRDAEGSEFQTLWIGTVATGVE